LKFGDLSVEKTWEAFKVLKGKRLTGSFGLLWGVKIPDTMTDDMPEGDLPYLEMLYKFAYGKKSYYDLAMTRHVEPQSNEHARCEGTQSRDASESVSDSGVCDVAYRVRTSSRHARKNFTGEFHLLPVFGFGNESEDGTDIYIILTYSRMLSIGY